MPYFEPSRPMPLSFMPPNGAISVEMTPSFDADDAVFKRLGDAPDPVFVNLNNLLQFEKIGPKS
jgi:hypothetical protein